MVSLREEYKKSKLLKEKAILEAGTQWVVDNVLLLNETFNRDSLQKLQSAIVKFDSIFAPFGAKVPEVQKSLEDAVNLLNRITMGEKITKKDGALRLTKDEKEAIKDPATYTVKYLSILYNNLSRFFKKDMPVLLQLPLFNKAKENPQTPLADLADSKQMKIAIMHALPPGSDIHMLLKRMYRSMDLPTLNYAIIAEQLLALTYDDFMSLMQVGKVPLVVSVNSQAETQPSVATEEAVPEAQTAGGFLTEEDEQILKEIGEINQQQIETIINGIVKIQNIIRNVPEMADTAQKLEKLRSEVAASVLTGGELNTQKAKMLAASANAAYNYFSTLGKLWPTIEKIIPTDRPLSDEELTQIETFMKRAQGGMIAKITNWFKSKLVPGLNPSEIATDIMNVVRQGQQSQNPIQGTQSLANLFQRLKNLNLPPAMSPAGQPQNPQSQSATPAQGTAGSQVPGTAAPATQSTTAAAAKQPQATGQTPPPEDAKTLAAELGNSIGINGNNPEFVAQVEKLLATGWKIVRPGAATQ